MTKAEEQLPDSVRIQNADHFFASLPAVIKHGGIVRSILQRAISFNCLCSSSSNLRTVTYRPCVMNLAIGRERRRLSRDLSGRFGDERYSMGELIAELTSSFLCADLQIRSEPRVDHAS